MECKGTLKDVTKDWMTGRFRLTFEVDKDVSAEIERLNGKLLALTAKVYRRKRSLDANALLWHCLGEIANVLRTDKWDVYLLMLKRYGKYTYIVVKENVVEAVKKQWRECEVIGEIDVNGQKGVQMLCYFGSSNYNTKEFSILLDGVVSEMKEMGIEAPASKEMRRALELWEKNGS